MEIVTAIFSALGGATKIATGIKAPVQTVHSWKRSGVIPKWRRSAVLGLVRKKRCDLTIEALTYLAEADGDRAATN